MRIVLCISLVVCLVQRGRAAEKNCKEEATISADDEVVITVDDIERIALKNLDDGPRGYYESGADEQQTLKENKEAFKRLRLRPRMLRGVKHRDMTVTLLGRQRVAMPLGISPSAMQRMAHPDGEEATARAVQEAGTVMILSTLSTTSIEDVRKAAPSAILWYQLYVFQDRDLSRRLVKRAEQAGYSALVLTVDTPVFGRRVSDVKKRFSLPSHLKLANFDGKELSSLGSSSGSGLEAYANSLFDQSLTWADVQWLRNITHLPVILKGILTAEDAVLAVRNRIPAIIVSNHGGRQLDGVASTIEVLPKIMRAVHGYIEVYLDGGVRHGTDVVKALALGAKAVFVGRPALWGLAYKGQQGVSAMLDIFRKEIDRAMALMGSPTVADLQPQMVARQEYYASL